MFSAIFLIAFIFEIVFFNKLPRRCKTFNRSSAIIHFIHGHRGDLRYFICNISDFYPS